MVVNFFKKEETLLVFLTIFGDNKKHQKPVAWQKSPSFF